MFIVIIMMIMIMIMIVINNIIRICMIIINIMAYPPHSRRRQRQLRLTQVLESSGSHCLWASAPLRHRATKAVRRCGGAVARGRANRREFNCIPERKNK